MARELRSEWSCLLPAPPGAVWAELSALERYTARWPWLHTFEARALEAGDRWRGSVRAPLPYRVTFTVDLTHVVPGRSIEALVSGDIAGAARVRLAPDGDGATALDVVTSLTPVRPFLVALSRAARPVAVWGHDRVIRRSIDSLAKALESPN